MSGNSKNKGNRGEREVCKFWKEWTNYEFSRTPASVINGGRKLIIFHQSNLY